MKSPSEVQTMSNHGGYREHRIRSSLAAHLGRSTTTDDAVRNMAATVYREDRGVMFFREDLERMPWQARELIESEARRLYGAKRGR
jgi:hypothetical protein